MSRQINELNTESVHYAQLSRKRVSASAVIVNQAAEILVVKPSYREGWLLPGGSVEENESPSTACRREIQEELGLSLNIVSLLCVEYQSELGHKTENVQFVFYAGIIDQCQESKISLSPHELSDYRFVDFASALLLLNKRSSHRIRHAIKALQNNGTVYIENGNLALLDHMQYS